MTSRTGPSSPRKGYLSTPTNRLPTLSPSELTPFSFSEDSLKLLASDIEKQNGIIPMFLGPRPAVGGPSSSFSTPSTPCLNRSFSQPRSLLLPPATPPYSTAGGSLDGLSINLAATAASHWSVPAAASSGLWASAVTPPSAASNQHFPLSQARSWGGPASAPLGGGGGSLGTPGGGRTMRDYEECFKEMRKENFNLKLRIFFLEERMGLGKKVPRDELAASNLELKIQLESCRQEMAEKAALLLEASTALESLETKIRQMETEKSQLASPIIDGSANNSFRLLPPPPQSPAFDQRRRLTSSPSPVSARKGFFFTDDLANNNNSTVLKDADRLVLSVLEETADEVSEAEKTDRLNELELVVKNNELYIAQMQKTLADKEQELSTCKLSMEDKLKEMENLQSMLQGHKSEAEQLLLKLQEKDTKMLDYEQLLSEAHIKHLHEEMEFKNQELNEFRSELRIRDSKIADLETLLRREKPEPAGTQADRITPQNKRDEEEEEGEETKKLKEQIKLQNQERKFLLKKIRMLKDQSSPGGGTEDTRGVEPTAPVKIPIARTQSAGSDLGVQCDLGHAPAILEAYQGSVKRYRSVISGLKKRLASTTEACDAIREQLEQVLDVAERLLEEEEVVEDRMKKEELKEVVAISRAASRHISTTLTLGLEIVDDNGDDLRGEAGLHCLNNDSTSEDSDDDNDDASTWNMELPNVADLSIDSSTTDVQDVVGDKPDFPPDICGNVIEHLNEEIERRDMNLDRNYTVIARLEEEIRQKDAIIRDQSDTINEYREEIIRLESYLAQSGGGVDGESAAVLSAASCRILSGRSHERSRRRRLRFHQSAGKRSQKVRRDTPDTCLGLAQALSEDSDRPSEPEPGVSLARIGLPITFPEKEFRCRCDRDILLSDTETDINGLPSLECSSHVCISSGSRVLEGLVASVLHAMRECEEAMILDSGHVSLEEELASTDSEGSDGDVEGGGRFRLCPSCSRSLPRNFESTLQLVHRGLSSGSRRLQRMKQRSQMLRELGRKLDKASQELTDSYALTAKLSSENLRLQGEKKRLEERLEAEADQIADLKLEVNRLNTALADREIEMEGWKCKGRELEAAKAELKDLEAKVVQLQLAVEDEERSGGLLGVSCNTGGDKSSPDTSSSFDFFRPNLTSGAAAASHHADLPRPRAFSSCGRGFPLTFRRDRQVTEVSSPDLGVDMESSDPFSSLERGPKVGSLAFDRLICENRQLRRDREVLSQKLARSKAALQDTLVRLARSNMHKQDQVTVSPAAVRRPTNRQPGDLRAGSADPANGFRSQSHLATSPGFSRHHHEVVTDLSQPYQQGHLPASPGLTRRNEAASRLPPMSPSFARRNMTYGDGGSDYWPSHSFTAGGGRNTASAAANSKSTVSEHNARLRKAPASLR